jgi:hypothetical protein
VAHHANGPITSTDTVSAYTTIKSKPAAQRSHLPHNIPPWKHLQCIIIWLCLPKPASPIPFLRNCRSSTLPRSKPTARRRTISILRTSTSDELRSSDSRGIRTRSHCCTNWRRLYRNSLPRLCVRASTASERSSSVVIGLSITKSTATVSFLCDDGSGTFAAVEAAAGGCAVGVGGAWASDELAALGACLKGDCAILVMVRLTGEAAYA